ncbi:hypothetical protein NIASO_07010 [Niabella soli DSM 19437]|uniref:Uncharacterized protein n=1 Tax=Niabella soli DSM 19437 TaxID=929713 RepID=W0F7H3_9BACT|nr:hypothetical protein NIASO_07010 [Niabella soli DSM 19437]
MCVAGQTAGGVRLTLTFLLCFWSRMLSGKKQKNIKKNIFVSTR